MPRITDTIAALATPNGTAALAVLRVSGPDTQALGTGIAGSPLLPRRTRHADYRARNGDVLDDVLFTFYRGPKSYTGEDTLEISSHGNPFIAQKILEDLFARGCRPAQPGEFTERAFLNGRIDLSQAEAVMDLIHARSDRALAAANKQLRGALGRQLKVMVDSLLDVLARIEAYIDFPDEDLPSEDRAGVILELQALVSHTYRLLSTSQYGAILRDGIKTVIIGEPNAGKSSLLNRLIGRDRALVSPEPGTTRDFIEERIIIGPHCLRIIDTAGLNPTPAPLERLGMDQTLDRVTEADLFLVVHDATLPAAPLPDPVARKLRKENTVLVFNKIDLKESRNPPLPPSDMCALAVSALTGEGIGELTAAIVRLADGFQQNLGSEVIAINARHANALIEARQGLQDGTDKLKAGESSELVASDLRSALNAFGSITGRIDNEQMLDRLFASFCIGK